MFYLSTVQHKGEGLENIRKYQATSASSGKHNDKIHTVCAIASLKNLKKKRTRP